MEKKKLPKIVDNNLKINVSDQNKTLIVKYFSSFRLTGNE
jgi:hypothetical protein